MEYHNYFTVQLLGNKETASTAKEKVLLEGINLNSLAAVSYR